MINIFSDKKDFRVDFNEADLDQFPSAVREALLRMHRAQQKERQPTQPQDREMKWAVVHDAEEDQRLAEEQVQDKNYGGISFDSPLDGPDPLTGTKP